MKRLIFTISIFLITYFLMSISAFAETYNPPATRTLNPLETEETVKSNYYSYKNPVDDVPKVDIDSLAERVNRKLYEIVHILQVIAFPVSLIIFIVSAFMLLIGVIGPADFESRGIYGMAISVFIYTAILYVTIIFQTFINFISS